MKLFGPHSEDCYEVIERALLLTPDSAAALSLAYEGDPNESYYEHCAIVQDALAVSGRTVAPGWLESIFSDATWVSETKALHAVADAVMAFLVADIIPLSVVQSLARPWISHRADLIVESA